MKKFLAVLSIIIISSTVLKAQFYIGPFIGFKVSGLKGTLTINQAGQRFPQGVADGGSTGFNAGIATGYQVIPLDVTGGLYKLDINLDASWSSFSFVENGFNSLHGSGSFVGNGYNGGTTNIFSFDIMPMHRFNFHNFILSPFGGIGFELNLLLTSDGTLTAQNINYTFTGTSSVKMGLLVFYGTLFNVSSLIKPYIQFKHVIPFGSETQYFDGLQSSGGGVAPSYSQAISDVPGFFSITAGVRFNL